MRVVINHQHSTIAKFNENSTIWVRIQEFLIANKLLYAPLNDEIGVSEGVIVWLPDVGPRNHKYPTRDQEIKVISDLGKLLFEDLKLTKNCLHFVIAQEYLNGEGTEETCWEAIEEVLGLGDDQGAVATTATRTGTAQLTAVGFQLQPEHGDDLLDGGTILDRSKIYKAAHCSLHVDRGCGGTSVWYYTSRNLVKGWSADCGES